MQFIIDFFFMFALGICATSVCCGALVLLSRVPPLLARQRATLWGVLR